MKLLHNWHFHKRLHDVLARIITIRAFSYWGIFLLPLDQVKWVMSGFCWDVHKYYKLGRLTTNCIHMSQIRALQSQKIKEQESG